MKPEDVTISPPELARQVLSRYLESGNMPEFSSGLSPDYGERSGVFVSLKKGGQLRGCIGTFEPARRNLAEEIAANAVAAAINDPRFAPVVKAELPDLEISVDILGPLEKVDSREKLAPKTYGVMVRKGLRTGILLPDLEGVETVEDQLNIACQKAGIKPGEGFEIFRFKVHRHSE